jgi:signal transduction histidine kinase
MTNVRGVIIDMLRESSTIVDAQGVIECGLLLYDSVSRLLRFEAMFANGVETDLEGTPLQGPFSVDSEPLALPWLRIQREPWLWGLTDDASILATTARAWHESKGTRSVAYLPLRRGQDCIGFVGFSLTSARPPTPQQVELLKSVGSQVALAVEVQRLAMASEQASAARERQRLADLRSIELTKANTALQSTIDAVTNMQSLDDFMPRVVAIVAEAFEAVGAGYFEHPEGTIYHRFWLEDGQFLAAAELPDLDPVHLPVLDLLARGFSVPPEHLGVEFRERLRPSIVHHRVATASAAMHALCVSRGWDWELNIPLFANDRTEAAITFFRHEDQPFTEADVSLAESLAKQISLARQVSRVGEREREITVARERAAELARANQVMSRVNDLMSSEVNPESALNHVLRELTTLVGADSAALYEYRPNERQLRFKVAFERGRITNHLVGHPYGHHSSPGSVDDFPAWPALVRGRRQLFFEIGADETIPPSNAWHVANGHKMLALSALLVGGQPVGMLGLAFMEDTPLSDSRREMFGALAQQMTLAMQLVGLADQASASAVANERAAAALARSRELERASTALQATIDAVSELASLEAFIPQALRIVVEAFGAKSAAYWEHTTDTIYLRHWLVDGRVFGPIELPGLDQSTYGFLAQLARGFSVSSDHLGVDFRLRTRPSVIHHRSATVSPELHSFAQSMGWDWELNVPLLVSGVADGALTLYRSNVDPFTDGDFSLAEALAKQISLAMKISRVAERARIDSLTRVQEQTVLRERERMSRDIHDTLAQGYAAILVHAQAMKLSPRSELTPPVLSGIEMFERLAKENLAHARRTMEDLRADPFGRTALAVTLRQCAAEEAVPGIFSVELDMPSEDLVVPRYVEVELRRIVKEALSNARRHARTGVAMLELSIGESRCTIRIIDQGVGFDYQQIAGSYGIRGMRERAGRAGADLAIETSPGHGTIIAMSLDMEIASDGVGRLR